MSEEENWRAERDELRRILDLQMKAVFQADAAVAKVTTELKTLRRSAANEHREHHHEVLCLVLKELAAAIARTAHSATGDYIDAEAEDHMKIARRYADLAYPPLKDEP